MRHTSLCDYTQTKAYDINQESMNLYEQVISLWRQNMSKGVGELLFTFAYLSSYQEHL